jgi:hypothetical protein
MAAKASKAEIRVPTIENGDWTPGSFGWYCYQAKRVSELQQKNDSLGAIYLFRLVKAIEEASGHP